MDREIRRLVKRIDLDREDYDAWRRLTDLRIRSGESLNTIIQDLKEQISIDLENYAIWKVLVDTSLQYGEPLVVTYFSGKGSPSHLEHKRRWISVEIHEIRSWGGFDYIHVLPRGYPYQLYRNYKGATREEPHSTRSSLFTADGLHFGTLTEAEADENTELANSHDYYDDYDY